MLPETVNLGFIVQHCNIDERADASIELAFLFSPLDSTRLDAAQAGLLSFLLETEVSTSPRAYSLLESNCCWPPKKEKINSLFFPTVYVRRIRLRIRSTPEPFGKR